MPIVTRSAPRELMSDWKWYAIRTTAPELMTDGQRRLRPAPGQDRGSDVISKEIL